MSESYVIGKERCPECAKKGKDVSHDNLAIYSDGHKFCFSCKYTSFPSSTSSFSKKASKEVITESTSDIIYLPNDSDIDYPIRALEWVEQYEITRNDLLNHNVMWSESMQRLIFPVYGGGNLIAWQGRSFSLNSMSIAKIPKWFGKGNLRDTFNILGKGNRLVLTEDIISAIKVSKCGVMAMPLYGCVVGRDRFKRLYSLYKDTVEVMVWLDPDKRGESIKEVKLGALCGLNTTLVFSNKDPKEHKYEEIKQILQKGDI